MNDVLRLTKALSDSSRVRALVMLRSGELCVCQIVDALGLAPATVSRHLNILREAGLVQREHRGKWAYYRLPESNAADEVRSLLRWLFTALDGSEEAEADEASAHRVRAEDLAELVACYRTGAAD